MTTRDPRSKVPEAVRVAIAQADCMRPGSPIADRLENVAVDAEFWVEAAEELHRLDHHLDAFDCWKRALQIDSDAVDRRDMARTLWSISSGDDIFAREALQQYEMAGAWQDVAFVRQRLHFDEARVLAAIEAALVQEPQLDWDDYWDFRFSLIDDWFTLGEHYLRFNSKAKAIECFGRAMTTAPDDFVQAELVAEAILEHIKLDMFGREV